MFRKSLGALACAGLLVFASCSSDVETSTKMEVASLEAPVVTVKAYKGMNFVSWQPVKNATEYRVYRDSKYLTSVAYDEKDLVYADVVTLTNELVNGAEYKYTVVATGDQSSRSAETNKNQFVLSEDDILGDSMTTVSVKADIPEIFSEVAAAEVINRTGLGTDASAFGFYYNNKNYPNEYSPVTVTVELSRDTTDGDTAGIFAEDYLSKTAITIKEAGTAMSKKEGVVEDPTKATPAYAGTYTYKVTTSWKDKYYGDKIVEAEEKIVIPGAEETVPALTVDNTNALGIKLSFTDTYGSDATYSIYRAEGTKAGTTVGDTASLTFTKLDMSKAYKTTSVTSSKTSTTYTLIDDEVLTIGKTYIYVLTGTYGEKVFKYNANAMQTTTYSPSAPSSPAFAALLDEDAGKVTLSWTNDADCTYEVIKRTINKDKDGNTTSEVETPVDIDAAVLENNVKTVKVDLAKLPYTGSYTFILKATNKNTLANAYYTDSISGYNITVPAITSISAAGIDTNKNAAFDAVKVTVVVEEGFDMSTAKIYRALVDKDTVDTYANVTANDHYEFVTGYTDITASLVAVADETAGNTYVFYDKGLKEADLAFNVYSYSVSNPDSDKKTLYTASVETANKITAVNFATKIAAPSWTLAENSTKRYTLSWNAQHNAVSDVDQNRNALPMTITVEACFSNEGSVATVTEWETVKVITDSADALIDSNFYWSKELNPAEDKNETEEFFYVRMIFANAATGEDGYEWSVQTANTNYKAPKVRGIEGIYSADVYTSTTEYAPALIVMATNDAINLASDFEVYITPLTAANVVYGVTKKVSLGSSKITSQRTDAADPLTELNNVYYNADKPAYYLTANEYKTNTDVTQYLVHVYDKVSGEKTRDIVASWK